MFDWLSPEYIASNATGAGAVYLVMRLKMEALLESVKQLKEYVEAIKADTLLQTAETIRRIERLENIQMVERRKT